MARNALMDFLQSASNEAAGAISGPVDLLGMGLRGLGVPVPQNALLSSDWMAQRGLTRPVPNGAAQVAGATAGLLSPVAVAAKAPQIAAGLLQAGRNAAAPSMQGAMGQRGAIGFPDRLRALEEAQRNAAKPVSEGGLGLGPNNTAAERAKAMGFTEEAFHGTRADTNTLRAVRPNYGTRGIEQSTGLRPVFATDSAEQAGEYAVRRNKGKGASIYPLLINRADEVGYDFKVGEYIKNGKNLEPDGSAGLGGSEWLDTMPLYHWAKDTKAPTVRMQGVHDGAGLSHNFPSTVTAIIDPRNVRSRFAAFDPANRGNADLLGGADPALLALLGLGAGGAAYYGGR